MKCFHCDSCGMMVFFQNDRCVKCGHALGFLPDALELSALEATPNQQLRAVSPAAGGLYRNCANGLQFRACNWLVPGKDPDPFCRACRLNEIIPDLADVKNLERWKKLEIAKRRCIYTLFTLGLPLERSVGGKHLALKFRFLQDKPNEPVLTGHQDGVITLNIAEADDDEREHRRLSLHEPYRTLVGHMRHETGHFYWDCLIADSPHLTRFRELFGDESVDYDAALQTYYQKGPLTGWEKHHVTVYASAHSWEDWAETWAHYMHIMDTLETAASFGLSVNADNAVSTASQKVSPIIFDGQMDFELLLAGWTPLTCALNSINRGMGLADLYPFVISPAVIEKLRFIHEVVHAPPSPT